MKWPNLKKGAQYIGTSYEKTVQEMYDKENGHHSRGLIKYRVYPTPDEFVLEAYMADELKKMKYSDKYMIKYLLAIFAKKQQEENKLVF